MLLRGGDWLSYSGVAGEEDPIIAHGPMWKKLHDLVFHLLAWKKMFCNLSRDQDIGELVAICSTSLSLAELIPAN